MRRKPLLALTALLAAAALIGGATALYSSPLGGGKTIKIKLLLPEGPWDNWKEPKLTIDGKEVKGEGEVRNITATTAKDKDFVKIEFDFSPNNYTQIVRPRKVTYKEGEVVVDMRKQTKEEPDHIQVRFVPTPPDFVDAMCKIAKVGKEEIVGMYVAKVGKDDVVYDLGCGDGRMVITAVKKFGAKRGVGIDLDADGHDLIRKCKESAKAAGVADKVEFRQGDVLKVNDLSDATVVLLYMGDDINKRLQPILKKTLKPGARVVSHRFLMDDDWPPDRSQEVTSTVGEYPGYTNMVHLWEIKGKK